MKTITRTRLNGAALLIVVTAVFAPLVQSRAQDAAEAEPVVPEIAVEEAELPPVAAAEGEDGLRFNFQDVPVDTVLNYLSESAGFIIVREAQVDGRVNVVSHQPLTRDEAIDLLNTVLNEKGLAAVRNDRTLTIVKREDAGKRNIPVRMGSNPETIPKSDEMVTQIIPIRNADATQLLETIQPLLPSYAVVSANKSSNAIVLTDTQTNIRRMAEIVRALDTSISDISEVKVYSLVHSKSTDVAKLITSLFESPAGTSQGNQGGNPFRQFFGRGGGPGGPDAQQGNDEESPARQAAMKVQAVADERTNSLVVSAPSDMIALIDTLVEEIDRVSPPATEIRVFPLQYADSDEMADVINSTFETTTTSTNANQPQGRRFFGGGGPPGFPGFPGGGGNQGNSQSASSDNTVKAVSDVRTNSVVVTAETTLMEQIAAMIEKLDGDPAKQQKVFVYKLKNADVESVAAIVQGLISQDVSSQGGTTNRSSATRSNQNSNTNRSTNNTNRNTGSSNSTRSRN